MDPIVAELRPAGAGVLLADLIAARRAGQLGDLYILFFDAGVSYGSGLPLERHPDPAIDALMQQVIDQWHRQSQAAIAWNDANEAPDWLRQAQEASHAGG